MALVLPAIALVVSSTALLVSILLAKDVKPDRPVPQYEPDEDMPPSPPQGTIVPSDAPTKTGYKLIDKILPELKKASEQSQIPLGLLVGWIAAESGGRLSETTKLDERGLFQLIPDESKSLGIDHQRLSVDPAYSINAGLQLIGKKYMPAATKLGIAPFGSAYYWRLVKLGHTTGSGDVKKLVAAAQQAGKTSSWDVLERWAVDNSADLKNRKVIKHAPAKWFPLVDKVYRIGRPFGFGNEPTLVAGDLPYNDIPDPLDVLSS